MLSVTLAQLRADARMYADQTSGTGSFISDTEANRIINQQINRWYDLLLEASGGNTNVLTRSLDIDTSAYVADSLGSSEGLAVQLPDGATIWEDVVSGFAPTFYKLKQLVVRWSLTDREVLEPIEWAEAQSYMNTRTFARGTRKGYILNTGVGTRFSGPSFSFVGFGDYAHIFPVPPAGTYTLELTYIPAAPVLGDDGDAISCVNGWDELITLGAAIRMLATEQNDTSSLQALFDAERERLEEAAATFDTQRVKRVTDVYANSYTARGPFERLPRP